MAPIQLIDARLLATATAAAGNAPRKRRNLNFHTDDAAPCNRLLNAIEPGSYVRPHCHEEAAKDETMIVVRGRLGLILFDAAGTECARHVLAAGSDCIGVNIPHGTWHTVLALEPGTIFFEAKAGPYRPLTDTEQASWAPAEGGPDAAALLAKWRASFL